MMTKSMLEELRDAAKYLGINTNQPLHIVIEQIYFGFTQDIQYNACGEPVCTELLDLSESCLSYEVRVELEVLVWCGTDESIKPECDIDDLPF